MNKVDKNRPVSSIKHEDKRAAIGSDGTAFPMSPRSFRTVYATDHPQDYWGQ